MVKRKISIAKEHKSMGIKSPKYGWVWCKKENTSSNVNIKQLNLHTFKVPCKYNGVA